MSQKVEKVQKGGEGSAPEIKKSTIQNVDFLIRGGGGHIFIFFPNVNSHFRYFSWRKNKLVLKWLKLFIFSKCFNLYKASNRATIILYISKKHQKVQNSKFGLFDKRGGGHIFIFFPNSNAHFRYFSWRKNKLVLKWFLGNFKCFKLMFHIWGGVPKIQSFPNFKSFPN